LNTRQFIALLLATVGFALPAAEPHWAFKPVANPKPPKVNDPAWAVAGLDRFVLHRLEVKGLKPVADADRHTWLRRVSFDLTGLPPSVAEIRAFEKDTSPQAFEKIVDRLLGTRAFGERWARHWLDLVGYADQIGTSNNIFAEHAWRYRDYVIDAIHRDKPFDRFIREQIAGDHLPNQTVEQRAASLVATGFLVLGDIEIVEADKAKLRVDIADQQLRKVSKAFLGMSVGCARCHDHKFDPIPQTDYYAMAGYFYSSSSVYKTKRGVWSSVNEIELPETKAQKVERAKREKAHGEKLAKWKAEREAARKRKGELETALKKKELPKVERDKLTKERDAKNGRIGQLDKLIVHGEFFAPKVPRAYGVRDVAKPGDMKITIRGNPRALGAAVPRGFLQVVTSAKPKIDGRQSGRREFAEWVAHKDNPLTARVAVNRVWQRLFGEGLVRSVDYFGLPGERPSHPALLDFLAHQFMRDGWSRKRLIRSLVLSRTYRLASTHNERAHKTDPANRLLWRMNRVRLDAEALRDAMLAASGRIKSSSGGPAMPLEFPENVNNIDPKNVNPPSFSLRKWRPGQELERTIYLPVLRSVGQPGPAELRNVFDFAQPSEFTGRRATTAVPTQALFLMNSPVMKKHATALAERVRKSEPNATRQLNHLWLTVFNRPITKTEQSETEKFLKEAGKDGWTELCHALLASSEFLMRL
jgi:hypothetical protein